MLFTETCHSKTPNCITRNNLCLSKCTEDIKVMRVIKMLANFLKHMCWILITLEQYFIEFFEKITERKYFFEFYKKAEQAPCAKQMQKKKNRKTCVTIKRQYIPPKNSFQFPKNIEVNHLHDPQKNTKLQIRRHATWERAYTTYPLKCLSFFGACCHAAWEDCRREKKQEALFVFIIISLGSFPFAQTFASFSFFQSFLDLHTARTMTSKKTYENVALRHKNRKFSW